MDHPLPRRLRILGRFLWPDAETRAYVRLLRRSAYFDRAFYLASNPRLRWLFRLAPERHYALFGEALGLSPAAEFSPRAYLFHNPDLDPARTRALLHYLGTGRAENRTALLPPGGGESDGLALPRIGPGDAPQPGADHAVVLHLYYPEMWADFARALAGQHFDFDLYVTLCGPAGADEALRARIRAAFPRARIWVFPNRGRDILPFVHLVNSGLLARYRAVCKLHGKKSPHRADGDPWRRALVVGVLGDPEVIRRRLRVFLDRDDLALWVADGQLCRGADWWGANRPRAEALLARIGEQAGELVFAAGSIYWIKPTLLDRIAALGLGAADFEPEQALVDGTTAHAMERVLGCLATTAGLGLCEARALDAPAPPRRPGAA
ncbi:hypothetical protein KBY27_22450 [Ruegeria pomeroyi]|uniref:Rhamnan synthesis protein F n=1 Tax=Ruegeria pomeroyi TaxID=89184 RepID=A0A9Q3WR06_9RHOB|nr:rhamnan synthesis F family protein [Ruegeria pomeroyi]MCE8540235.1 hypothetical protein [Ruegeria pomeroyi]